MLSSIYKIIHLEFYYLRIQITIQYNTIIQYNNNTIFFTYYIYKKVQVYIYILKSYFNYIYVHIKYTLIYYCI